MSRSQPEEPGRTGRAGWSGGRRISRRKMWLSDHSEAPRGGRPHPPEAEGSAEREVQREHRAVPVESPSGFAAPYPPGYGRSHGEPPPYPSGGYDPRRFGPPRQRGSEPPAYPLSGQHRPWERDPAREFAGRGADGPADRYPDGPADRSADRYTDGAARERERRDPPPPRKLTVTRVMAWRSRQLTEQGIRAFKRAAGADGADRSGLTALTYATMMNYATDAAIAVALANTLFFSAATAESKTKVALYLLITVAPFAVVAPVIGPLLDRIQRGRRAALAASFVGRGVLAVVMAFHFNDWGLYPAALGVMVLSKSYTVLRAAVTPRVLPRAITLVTTNSRLTAFGLSAGAVFGALAAGLAHLTGSQGALIYTAALCGLGTWLCLRIPRWVEVTEGEVPAALRNLPRTAKREPMGRAVVVALWANCGIRTLTGFLMLFVAFAVKAQTEQDPARQLFLLGIVGATAGVGGFIGNAVGSRQRFDRSDILLFSCLGACVALATTAALLPGIVLAAICALVAATASALAKVCLDAVIQRDLPERSRASAFGRSETVLQLAWVAGGAIGLLLPPVYWIGFAVIAAVVALVGTQAVLVNRGSSLLPWIAHREQPRPAQS